MNINVSVVICAMLCITIIECFALSLGFNGTLLKIVIALLAGGAGLVVPSPLVMRK